MEPKKMPGDIKIQAQVIDDERCEFTVDRPVFPGAGSLQYSDPEKAKDNPLAERIFEIDGITAVMLSGNTITLAHRGKTDWSQIGKKVGAVIRTFLHSQAANLSAADPGGNDGDMSPEDRNKAKIQNVLDTYVNPGIAGHGGVVSLLDVKGSSVYIRMGGGCQGCGMASVTLKQGVEKAIRQYVPEITEVLDTTDHAAGKNPFYAPSTK